MKLFKFLLIGLLITASTSLTSCKKENRIEKNLWKQGGEWNIETYSASQVSTYTPDNFNVTMFNFGTFTFHKNGSGIYKFTEDGDIDTGVFAYTNTDDKLTIIIDNEGQVYNMDWKKNSITLTITTQSTGNYPSPGQQITYSETIVLKKKK